MSSRPYEILITRRAVKDIQKLTPTLKKKLYDILTRVIAVDPFCGKKLVGDLRGSYSHRLTYQDRIVYSINHAKRTVYIERGASHYGD